MHGTIHIDGGSRGNPGPASYAVVLKLDGVEEPIEECDTLGNTTNNVAEYTALVNALELAALHGCTTLTISSDSELLVKQMNGQYKVKNEDLLELYQEAKDLLKPFKKVTISHVRREQNKRADQLCNLALDGSPRPRGQAPTPAAPVAKSETLDEAGLRLLRTLNDTDQVEAVWQQIKKLFQK